jgi:hypothetical protein
MNLDEGARVFLSADSRALFARLFKVVTKFKLADGSHAGSSRPAVC